jgi:hypothetical protein
MQKMREIPGIMWTCAAHSRPGDLAPHSDERSILSLAGLGDREAVFKTLESAEKVSDVHVVVLPVDPKWDAYPADPRFMASLDRAANAASLANAPVGRRA